MKNPSEFRNILIILKTDKRNKCNDCKKKTCECIDKTKDEFLKQVLVTRGYSQHVKPFNKYNEKIIAANSLATKRDSEFFLSQKYCFLRPASHCRAGS